MHVKYVNVFNMLYFASEVFLEGFESFHGQKPVRFTELVIHCNKTVKVDTNAAL